MGRPQRALEEPPGATLCGPESWVMGLRHRRGFVGDGPKVSPARPPGSSWASWVFLGLLRASWVLLGLLGVLGHPGSPWTSGGVLGLRPERGCGAWGTGLLCQASWSLGLLGTPTRRKQPHPPHPLRYGTTYSLFPTPKHTSHYMQGSLTNTPPVTCQEPKKEAENQGKKN